MTIIHVVFPPTTVYPSGSCALDADSVLATVMINDNPIGIVVSTEMGRAYILSKASGKIIVIDTASHEVKRGWDIGHELIDLEFGAMDASIFAIRRENLISTLLVIDAETGAILRSTPLGFVLADLAVSRSGRIVYLVGWDAGQIRGGESSNGAILAIEGRTGQVVALRILGGLFFRYQTVAVDPASDRLFVTWTHRYGKNGLEVFEGQMLDRLGALQPYGDNAFSGLAFDASGRRLFVSTTWRWVDATSLDLPIAQPRAVMAGDALLGRVDVGRPARAVYDEGTSMLYVTRWPIDGGGESGDDMIVVNTRSYQVVGSVPIGVGDHSIALDRRTHRLFVTSSSSSTLTVIQGIPPEANC